MAKVRRLRIFEQLLIVFFIAILPLCAVALIVTNINQHAVRAELRYAAAITADNVYQRLTNSIEGKKITISYIAKSLHYIKSDSKRKKFLKDITATSDDISGIDIVNTDKNIQSNNLVYDFNDSSIEIFHNFNNTSLSIYAKLKNNQFLREKIDLNKLSKNIFKFNINDKRQVYIIDSGNKVILSHNRDDNSLKSLLSELPDKYQTGQPVFFGPKKNQPNIFLKVKEPNCSIIVITPRHLTRNSIIKARYKIIVALIIAAVTMLTCAVAYAFSLYTNIRQLLRAIAAIGSGNYKKRVRLIKRFFTPHEVIYIADEFNKMSQQVENSYDELQKANTELSKLDDMKSNLIDTVSHEFRTPLTCIKGYTSRLLRNDIQVNDETKIKSLKVIKQQTERLSRMVEDLLVIPDLDSLQIRMLKEEISLKETIEDCILSIQQKQMRPINFSCDNAISSVIADQDRLEQVIINLLDNAIKYSHDKSEINIKAYLQNNTAYVSIQNQCDPISMETLSILFDKFTRIEDNLTRTTRGTGLGLYISKGLIEAMGGKISLSAQNGFEVTFSLPIAVITELVSHE